MRFDTKEIGLYAIILAIIYPIIAIVILIPKNILYGSYSLLFFILLIVALVSVFWKYKFNWIVISLPFFLNILYLLPKLFSHIALGDLTQLVQSSLAIGLNLSIILYLFIKGITKIKNMTYEIIFAIVIFILLVSKFFV